MSSVTLRLDRDRNATVAEYHNSIADSAILLGEYRHGKNNYHKSSTEFVAFAKNEADLRHCDCFAIGKNQFGDNIVIKIN